MRNATQGWWRQIANVGMFCLAVLLSGSALAATGKEALLGTWQGELVISPATRLTVQFIVRRDGPDAYSAVLHAPGEPNLQNIPVTRFGLDGEQVSFEVGEVNGQYAGKLDGKSMTGKWRQGGAEFDLVLKPHVIAKIPDTLAKRLEGPWNGVLKVPNTDLALALVINFRPDPKSITSMSATVDSPEQGRLGVEADSVVLEGDTISVTVLQPDKVSFSGKLQGNQLVGRWTQGGSAPLTLTKGKYQAVRSLDVAAPARKLLAGNWYGQFGIGTGIALHFKETAAGKFVATLDSPYEGRKDIPVSALSVKDGNISLRVDGVGVTLAGTVTKDAISGTFTSNGQASPLTLRRGVYVPEAINLPEARRTELLGQWEGRTANTNMTLSFDLNKESKVLAKLDISAQQLYGLPVSDLKMTGTDISMTVRGIAAEFKGKIKGNTITGEWTMPSLQFPITFRRGGATASLNP